MSGYGGHPADTGCEYSPKCVDCPLSVCRYDMPQKRAGAEARWLTLAPLIEHGMAMEQACSAVGIARRSGFRLRKQMLALHGTG